MFYNGRGIASFFSQGGQTGARHFSRGARPSKSRQFRPLCTGKCPVFLDLNSKLGGGTIGGQDILLGGQLPPKTPRSYATV